jgi:hypothetical protein
LVIEAEYHLEGSVFRYFDVVKWRRIKAATMVKRMEGSFADFRGPTWIFTPAKSPHDCSCAPGPLDLFDQGVKRQLKQWVLPR